MSDFPRIILRDCNVDDMPIVAQILRTSIRHMIGREMIAVFGRGTVDERTYFIRKNKVSLLICREPRP